MPLGWLRAGGVAVVRLPARAVVLLLRAWRYLVSPVYGQTCRFYPSCSAYALEAVEVHGLGRGGLLAARRLGRCHPWNPGGVDPVPPAAGAPTVTTDAARAGSPERPAAEHAHLPKSPAARAAHYRPPRRAA